jgi:predicted amidohydrolase
MKKTVKISAINSRTNILPLESNPYSKKFNPDTVKGYIESNLEKACNFMHDAGKIGSDLVFTCEDFMGYVPYVRNVEAGDRELFMSIIQEIPGPATEKIGAIAKQYNMHIVANFYEKAGDKVFNTTVLIGRDGKIIGTYRKVHLPMSEKWLVTRGSEFPVYETDIGRLGFATCYDMAFTEHCRNVALNGADIIVYSTAGVGVNCTNSVDLGRALWRVRAAENMVYLAVSMNSEYYSGKAPSCIIDSRGEILAEKVGADEGLVTAEFEPDYDLMRPEMFDTFFSGVDSVKARHFLEREPLAYSRMTEPRPPVLER